MYIVYFELGSGSAPFREAGYAGGFVSCVVPSGQIVDAIRIAEKALTEDGYEIIDVERAIRFDREEWSDNPEIVALAEKAAHSGSLEYSDFDVWGH